MRAEIALPEIVEHGHDGALTDSLGDLVCALQIAAGGLADEPPVFCQTAAYIVRLIDVDGDLAINNALVKNFRYDVPRISERFETFDARELVRRYAADFNVGIVLFEPSSGSRHGAPCPYAADEMGQFSSALFQDFDGCSIVVGAPVVLVLVLVGEEVFIGRCFDTGGEPRAAPRHIREWRPCTQSPRRAP